MGVQKQLQSRKEDHFANEKEIFLRRHWEIQKEKKMRGLDVYILVSYWGRIEITFLYM